VDRELAKIPRLVGWLLNGIADLMSAGSLRGSKMRFLILFGLLQLICISGCNGQGSTTLSIEHGARFVTWVAPEYSSQAQKAGLSGTTKLRVLVLANGEVGAVEIAESSQNRDLDQSAIASAYNCTFSPAMLGGQPTQSWLKMNCYFPPNFIEDTPCTEESAIPRLVFFEQPEYSEIARLLGQEGEVVIKVLVMPDGTVGLAEIMSGPGFEIIEHAALEAARHCIFEPGILDCAPATSVMALPYNFKLSDGRERQGEEEF
jgi:TonB family protein